MAITKKQRQEVLAKSGGVCWYCGCELSDKIWHVDHFISKHRNPNLDIISNYVPSCAPCNLFKRTFTIDEFRDEILLQTERARKSSVNFRTAERFGLIRATYNPVVFWFEKR